MHNQLTVSIGWKLPVPTICLNIGGKLRGGGGGGGSLPDQKDPSASAGLQYIVTEDCKLVVTCKMQMPAKSTM